MSAVYLTPREEFERQFGEIEDETWQWVKEFCTDHHFHDENEKDVVDLEEFEDEIWMLNMSGRLCQVFPIDDEHPEDHESRAAYLAETWEISIYFYAKGLS